MDKVNISDIHSSALPACVDITLLISGVSHYRQRLSEVTRLHNMKWVTPK